MKITFDPGKRAKTIEERGLDFADAPMVLESPYRLDVRSVRVGEPRIQSFAYVFDVLTVLTVVHMTHDEIPRIISFRQASEEERSVYHAWLEEDFNDSP